MRHERLKQVLEHTFGQYHQSKLSRTAFYPFLFEFQALFQVVGDGREVHHLVGLCKADDLSWVFL
ncbi:hypothetical protein BFP77_09485 [Maribacter sp. 4U21]|nr:hypothetical protein BFP77_09485 [Maribacter sp. 4U21]